MQKCLFLAIIVISGVLVFSSHVSAYDDSISGGILCVDGSGAANLSADFQNALTASTDTDAELRLISDTFSIPASVTGHFTIVTSSSLEISGGWNADCSSQSKDSPALTTLAGGTTQTGENAGGGVLSVKIADNASAATLAIHNLTIRNGSSTGSGGGLYFLHTGDTGQIVTVNLYDLVVEDNKTAIFGAGMQIWDNGTARGMFVNISDCIVRRNTITDNDGGRGGLSVEVPEFDGAKMADTTISNCQILDNSTDILGGGLYVNSGTGDTVLVNNIIADNFVSNDNGGGVYIINSEGGNITLTNNTITNNKTTEAGTTGGGLYVDLANTTSSLDIFNNIIFNNTAAGNGDDIFLSRPYPNDIAINNNDFNSTKTIGFLIDGDGTLLSNANNLNVNPNFASPNNLDPADNDYRLQASSRAIDAGSNSAPYLPATDIEGEDRIQDAAADIGAYEHPGTTGGGDGDSDSDSIGGQGCFIASASGGPHYAGHPLFLALLGVFAVLVFGVFPANPKSGKTKHH